MEITREINREGLYDYKFKCGDKTLWIFFGGNLDLYMILSDNTLLEECVNKTITFDITKENYELFSIFEKLYNDISLCKPYGEKIEDDSLWFYETAYNNVYKNYTITWVSDDDPVDSADRMSIDKINDDLIRLTFIRTNLKTELPKFAHGISIRFRNSGSRYDPFNSNFMTMYKDMQTIDPIYHQMHIEELVYKKVKR